MEILDAVWMWVLTAIGGVSLGGIIVAIITGCIKGAFNKLFAKINVEKIADDTTTKAVQKIKKVSFEQSIQPIVESELKKITESANEYIKTSLAETQKKYDNLIAILEKFYAYFDDSLVSDNKKQELKQALEYAKNEPILTQKIIVEETIEPEPKVAIEPQKTAPKNRIER